MNAELLRRGVLNIEDAVFVRDHFIPVAMKSERWNIVVYEVFRTIELLMKGMVCLSGHEPRQSHELQYVLDDFLDMLAAKENSPSFFYSVTSPSGNASYGVYSDGTSIELMKKVHGTYTSMGPAMPWKASIDQLVLLRLEVKEFIVSVYCGDDRLFTSSTDSTILESEATEFSRSFQCPDRAQRRTLRKATEWLRKRRLPAGHGEETFSPGEAKEAVSRMNSALSAVKAFVTL